ncbi:hypothetical protein BJX61DRAFT_199 [Aspergillus egyptiacus]|nr:hypothetical protein BJX61DRAFT_199 [Aspergillus egyptiacus]
MPGGLHGQPDPRGPQDWMLTRPFQPEPNDLEEGDLARQVEQLVAEESGSAANPYERPPRPTTPQPMPAPDRRHSWMRRASNIFTQGLGSLGRSQPGRQPEQQLQQQPQHQPQQQQQQQQAGPSRGQERRNPSAGWAPIGASQSEQQPQEQQQTGSSRRPTGRSMPEQQMWEREEYRPPVSLAQPAQRDNPPAGLAMPQDRPAQSAGESSLSSDPGLAIKTEESDDVCKADPSSD